VGLSNIFHAADTCFNYNLKLKLEYSRLKKNWYSYKEKARRKNIKHLPCYLANLKNREEQKIDR